MRRTKHTPQTDNKERYCNRGATFGSRQLKLVDNIMGTVTTFATKDNLVCEFYE